MIQPWYAHTMAPRRSTTRFAVLAALPILGACNLAVSLDGLNEGDGGANTGNGGDATGGSGAAGGAGAGAAGGAGGAGGATTGGSGTGGQSTGTPADWAGALDAVWRFEEAPPNLGVNSGSGDGDLVEVGLPGRNTSVFKQGAASLELTDTHRLSSNGALFNVSATDSFTFGGWFKRDAASVSAVIGKMGPGNPGYLLEGLDGNTAKCFLSDDSQAYLAQAPADAWLPGEWVHLACRYDAIAGELTVVIAGVPGQSLSASLLPSPSPFSISDGGTPFVGLADEAFFTREALAYSTLARMVACGIDGVECVCNEDDPTLYDDCGRADPNCGSLPACDLASP